MSRRLHKSILAAILCACLQACGFAAAAEPGQDDGAVEAAYLYRFASYVEWPTDALSGPEFTIAVLGDDRVVQELQRILPGHLLQNRPGRVRQIQRIQDLGTAQILFVGQQYTDGLKLIIESVAARPLLIVTANDHGLDDGSCVNFLLVDHRVRFEVSMPAADHAGLKVSAELLSVAARVQGRSSK